MSSHVTHDPGSNKWRIELDAASRNCYGLTSAPDAMETDLREGTWLVLLFAVWSTSDRPMIAHTCAAAEQLAGIARVAIRPFDDPEEHSQWCPAIRERYGSPVWLVLRNGDLIAERTGPMTEQEIICFVRLSLTNVGERS